MIKVIKKHVVVNETYQTSDGTVFEDYNMAEKHERERQLEYIDKRTQLQQRLKTIDIDPSPYSSFSPLFNLNIDNTLIWFNSEKEARNFMSIECEVLNNPEEEYDYTLRWEGPGYYYRTFNSTEDDDGYIEVIHNYRKLSNDIDILTSIYSHLIDRIKKEEQMAVYGYVFDESEFYDDEDEDD